MLKGAFSDGTLTLNRDIGTITIPIEGTSLSEPLLSNLSVGTLSAERGYGSSYSLYAPLDITWTLIDIDALSNYTASLNIAGEVLISFESGSSAGERFIVPANRFGLKSSLTYEMSTKNTYSISNTMLRNGRANTSDNDRICAVYMVGWASPSGYYVQYVHISYTLTLSNGSVYSS